MFRLIVAAPALLLGCAAPALHAQTPAPAPAPAAVQAVAAPAVTQAAAGVDGIVLNGNDSGAGSLRAVLAACPDHVGFAFSTGEIHVTAPVVIDCPHPVSILGPRNALQVVPGTEGRTVGAAELDFAPIVQPGVTVVNRGGGDGIVVRSDDVTIDTLAVRGTTADGFADIAVRGAARVVLLRVTLGLDSYGLNAPPASYPTGSGLFLAVDSSSVSVSHSAAGWNASHFGAVAFWNVHGGHVYRTAIANTSVNKPPVQTLDALSLLFGTSDFIIREVLVLDNTSSSAVELHTADRVVIDDSTFGRIGRAGVTVFDARDVTIRGVDIFDAGTCGSGDDGGIVVYGGSQRTRAIGSDITTKDCQGTPRPVMRVMMGSAAELL